MEKGVCIVAETSDWGTCTVGIVNFAENYDAPPQVQLTASQEGRPSDWAGLLCSVLEISTSRLVIDFDGWKIIDGVPTFQQNVYSGAKCYWNVV